MRGLDKRKKKESGKKKRKKKNKRESLKLMKMGFQSCLRRAPRKLKSNAVMQQSKRRNNMISDILITFKILCVFSLSYDFLTINHLFKSKLIFYRSLKEAHTFSNMSTTILRTFWN